jgi:FeS assembly protein IscX
MGLQLHWEDAEELGLALADKFPDTNPLEVRFTDLRQWIAELPLFVDDPSASTEGKLERIQMAWYEEWQERNDVQK